MFVAPAAQGLTLAETFNGVNSATLGVDLTWAEVSGDTDFRVIDNRAEDNGVNDWVWARAEHDLAGDDHFVQADVTWEDGTLTVRGM